jgi:hypothetical protein
MYNLYNKGSISLGKMRPATIQNQKKKKEEEDHPAARKHRGRERIKKI